MKVSYKRTTTYTALLHLFYSCPPCNVVCPPSTGQWFVRRGGLFSTLSSLWDLNESLYIVLLYHMGSQVIINAVLVQANLSFCGSVLCVQVSIRKTSRGWFLVDCRVVSVPVVLKPMQVWLCPDASVIMFSHPLLQAGWPIMTQPERSCIIFSVFGPQCLLTALLESAPML